MSLSKIDLLGIGIALTGIAHFIAPKAFVPITKDAFPDDTESWIYRNGASETAIGAAIACRKTRKLGFAGLAVYGAFLGSRAAAAAK